MQLWRNAAMTNRVAFDFDSLMALPVSEANHLLSALRDDGYEVHIVSWRAMTLDGYRSMISALAKTRLLYFTTRIARTVEEGVVYISRDCMPIETENLLDSIRALAHREEK